MRKITAIVVAVLLGMPALTLAENSDTVATVANGVTEGSALQQLTVTASNTTLIASVRQIGRSRSLRLSEAKAQSTQSEKRSWPGRHPVLFGTLVGGGVGALSAGLWCGGVPCEGNEYGRGFYVLSGGGIGAGLGAGVGLVVALLRR
jgi:hypothetical protein